MRAARLRELGVEGRDRVRRRFPLPDVAEDVELIFGAATRIEDAIDGFMRGVAQAIDNADRAEHRSGPIGLRKIDDVFLDEHYTKRVKV